MSVSSIPTTSPQKVIKQTQMTGDSLSCQATSSDVHNLIRQLAFGSKKLNWHNYFNVAYKPCIYVLGKTSKISPNKIDYYFRSLSHNQTLFRCSDSVPAREALVPNDNRQRLRFLWQWPKSTVLRIQSFHRFISRVNARKKGRQYVPTGYLPIAFLQLPYLQVLPVWKRI